MPIINPSMVPLLAPGNMFDILNDESLYSIRWLLPSDPVFYSTANRGLVDSVFRQLMIAKAIDNISLRLSHQANFPFIISPIIVNGSLTSGLPLSWIWDIHVSLPQRWKELRLAKIKRTSGVNDTGGITGNLRFYFTAEESTTGIETYLFYIDYTIDSNLTYQVLNIQYITDETPTIDVSEHNTLAGYVIMRTIDPNSDTTMENLLVNLLYPPIPPSTSTTGELQDSPAGGASNPSDFDPNIVIHGTGMLTASAFNAIPALDMIIDNWLIATNYPFRTTAGRISVGSNPLIIPQGLFDEFSILAPTPDLLNLGTIDDVFPVWISKIERLNDAATEIKIWFSTYDIEHSDSGYKTIELASLTLKQTNRQGDVVQIISENSLYSDKISTNYTAEDWEQGFGQGYIVLSKKWGTSTSGLPSEVKDMFDDLATAALSYFGFNMNQTILSAYSTSRLSKNIPTNGQFAALRGSAGDLKPPTMLNTFVVKDDSGLGEDVDFAKLPDFGSKVGIADIGHKATHCTAVVRLDVDQSVDFEEDNFDKNVKPRLEYLLGRSLVFGDRFFDGVRLLFFDGDKFIDT